MMRFVPALFKRFVRDRNASVALVFSLAVIPLVAIAGAAYEFVAIGALKNKLQAAADAGALRAARELRLARVGQYDLTQIATPPVMAIIGQSQLRDVTVTAPVIENNTAVDVRVSGIYDPQLIRIVYKQPIKVTASAVARSVGFPICALALDETPLGVATLYLEASAKVTAQYCAIQSNSKSPVGITALNAAHVTAGQICSSGGAFGPKANFLPAPLKDCPIVADPLSSRTAPPVGACGHTDEIVAGGTVTLNPGIYCGGLKLSDGANVTLSPGEYVIKDGEFAVESGATLTARGVGVYLTGAKTMIRFSADSNIRMTAPVNGPLAGILFFEDRASPPYRVHKLTSDNAPELLGTIYLPQGQLIVDASRPVADQSAFTIIVARRIALMAGPNLILNSDYGSTSVPVPGGLNSGRTFLVR